MKPIIARIAFMLCCCLPLAANAQWNYPQYSMSTTTISSCFGRLYDSGGPTNSYGANESDTTTILSEGPITLTFFGAFSLQEDVDILTVYDGTAATGNLLGIFTGQQLPGTLTAQSGTATLVFTSNGSISTSGFSLYWESDVAFPVPPALSIPVIPACNSNELTIELSNSIPCEWLESASFEVYTISQQFDVDSVDFNCSADQTDQVTLTLNRSFEYNCDVIVNLTIQIPDECEVLHEFEILTTFFYDNCPINAQLTAESSTVCLGECTSISMNLPGCLTYVYQWNNGLPPTTGPHNECPAVTTTYSVLVTELETNLQQTFTITVVVEDIGIITQEQSVCQSGPAIQLESQVAGEWYGDGVLSPSSLYNPDAAGAGDHTVYIQTDNCLDSLVLTVIPIETAESVAACVSSAPFQLEAIPNGGVWSGSGVTAQGVFDPVSIGSYTVTYDVNGCSTETEVNVDEIAGPAAISPVCQSVSPFQIEVTPAGGIWSGNDAIIDELTGLFDPALADPGDVSLTYSLNGCDEVFSFEVRAIGVIDSVVLCLDNAPTLLDPAAQPAGGVWNSPTGAILSSGIFNPGVFDNDTETIAIYTYSTGYLCRDTVRVSIIGTEVQTEELSFCFDNPAVDIDSDLFGTIAPANGIWTGTGVSGSQIEGYTLSPEDMPIGLNSIYYSANGCSDTVLIVVYGPNLPDAPQVFCASDAVVVLADAVPGGTWSGSGIVDEAAGLFDPSLADEGTYFIYWNNPLGCGDSIQVTVEKVVTPVITGISDIYCSLDYVVDFTTEPDGGQLVGDLSSNSFNPSILPEGDYMVFYRLTPEHCPVIEDTATFTIYPPLSVEPLSAETNPVCYSETIELNAIVDGGYPENALTYIWSNGGPNAADNSQLYTETTEVTLTVDDGCSEPVIQSIEIVVHPLYNYTAQTSAIDCLGEPGTIQLVFGTTDSYEISWNDSLAGNPYNGQAGEEVEITITDENLCERDTVISIPSYPAFSFVASVPETLCIAETGEVELTIVPAATYDIEWNGVIGTTSFTASAGAELDIQVTDDFGCAKDTSVTLEMHPDFQFTLTNASILCPEAPAPVELDITPSASYEVLWNGEAGNPNMFVSQAGATLDIVITDQFGCEKDTTLVIESYPDFTLGLTIPPINCPGEPAEVELSLSPVGVYVIQWNGVTNDAISYMTTAGEQVSINVEDVHGCAKDTVAFTLAHPEFLIQVEVPSALCEDETGTIVVDIVPSGDYDVEWNGIPGGYSYGVQAGSEVGIVIRDEFECERDTSFMFEAFPSFTYELTNASIVCPGEPAVVEIDYNPTGDYTVLWNGQSGNPNIYNAEAGSSLSIVISDEYGCEKDTSLTISSYSPFFIDVVAPAPSCPGELATVNLSVSPAPLSAYVIEWNGVEQNQSFLVTESGSEVSIEVTDVNGCAKDTIVVVEAFAEPVASFSIDQIGTCIPFEEMGNITLINNSVNGQTGTWDFGDGQTAGFSPGNDVVHGYANAGTYTITLAIQSPDGCVDSTIQEICTLPEEPIFIPDIFSPNDDGRNDTLYVRGKFVTRLEFRVYNRWGEVVFETTSVSQGWDGNVRGIPAQSGSYYYTITATVGSATRVEEVGEIVLIR